MGKHQMADLEDRYAATGVEDNSPPSIEKKIMEHEKAIEKAKAQAEGHAKNFERVSKMLKTWEETRDKLYEEVKTEDNTGPHPKWSKYKQIQQSLDKINIMIEDWEYRPQSIAPVGRKWKDRLENGKANMEWLVEVADNSKGYRTLQDIIKTADAPTPQMTEYYLQGVRAVRYWMDMEAESGLRWALAVQPMREACETYEKKYGRPADSPDSDKKTAEDLEQEEEKKEKEKAGKSRGRKIDTTETKGDLLFGRGNH